VISIQQNFPAHRAGRRLVVLYFVIYLEIYSKQIITIYF